MIPSSSPAGAKRIARQRKRVRLALIATILLLAFLQRLSAAHQLPVDADEPVYTWAASHYAALMARGEWNQIPHYTYNAEHPVFVKLLYAVGLRAVGYEGRPGQPAEPVPGGFPFTWGDDRAELGDFLVDRHIAVLFGTLQVLVVALVNPLAGALLAIHTMTAKYTAEVYLEAVPSFAATLAILAYERARRRGEGQTGSWFWLSAGLLGVAAASKYIYAVVGLAAVPFIVWQQRRKPWNVLLYGLLALAVFLALNPILWPDPLGRLRDSILFHGEYTQSAAVARYDHPWWQPVNWMGGAATWHPGVFWFPFDFFTFLLGLVGLPFLFRQNKLYFAWFVVGWAFLFLWPTKWPQYTLIVTPVICLAVGAMGRAIADKYDLRLDRETWERIAYYLPDRTFWIAPPKWLLVAVVVLVALCGVGQVAFRFNRARQLRGWTTYTASEGQVAGDLINTLALDAGGRVWVGTRNGLTIYEGDRPTILRATDSPLPDNRVTALALDSDGRMWVGTETGVSMVEGEDWTTYTAAEMGLGEARVRALATDREGRTWVGTRTGAAMWDGAVWRTFSPAQAGLTSETVLALAVDDEGRAWMGTDRGLAVLDLSAGEPAWITYTAFASGLASNSARALQASSQRQMWVGTGGGGVCLLNQEEWICYRTANSNLPWNTVAALAMDSQGRVWVATQKPTQIGGAVAVFDGQRWRTYTPRNSGLVDGQVTAILEDRQGRFWFGTPGSGLSVFEPPDE